MSKAILPILLAIVLAATSSQIKIHPDSLAVECYEKSYDFQMMSQFDSSLFYLDIALDTIVDKSFEFGLYPVLLHEYANALGNKGRLDDAIDVFSKLIDYCRGNDTAIMARAFTSRAVYFRQKGLMDSATVSYFHAIELAEKISDNTLLSETYSNLSVLYDEQGMSEDCLKYAQMAYDKALEQQDEFTTLIVLVNLIECRSKQQLSVCDNDVRKALMLCDALGTNYYKLRLYTALIGTGADSMTMKYMSSADSIAALLPYGNKARNVFMSVKASYYKSRGEYAEALSLYKQTRDVYLKLGSVGVSSYSDLLEQIISCLDSMGRSAETVPYYEELVSNLNKTYDIQREDLISSYSARYDTKLKELTIVELERQNLRRRNIILTLVFAASLIALAASSLLLFLHFRNKRLRSEAELAGAWRYIEGLEHERSRLAKELHDGVCNDLLGIGLCVSSMTPGKDSMQEIMQMIDKTRNDVRFISHELMPPRFKNITLDEAISSFVSQIGHMSGKSVSFVNECEHSALKALSEEVAYEVYRIVQELLSNSLKHSSCESIEIVLGGLPGKMSVTFAELFAPDVEIAQNVPSGNGYGIGISTMSERLKCINASIIICQNGSSKVFKVDFC